MKKYIISLVAILLLGIAQTSHAFFGAADARTTDSSASVKIPVYNNAGADLDAGDVVVWDIGSSTGDNDLYVTRTTTADTGLVAGVVWPADIADGDVGSIVVYGFAECDSTPGVPAGTLLCTHTVAGDADACNAAADEAQAFAIAPVAIATGGQGVCFVINK